MDIMWYFSTEAYQIHAGQCLLIFLKAGHRIHPGGLNGGVPEDIRQSNHILFHTVEGEGEQMPQIMRKNLIAADIGMETQLFHRFPDIAAIQRSSGIRDENTAGCYLFSFTVCQQLFTQSGWKEYIAELTFILHGCLSAFYSFHSNESMLRYTDSGRAYGLKQQIHTLIMGILRCF